MENNNMGNNNPVNNSQEPSYYIQQQYQPGSYYQTNPAPAQEDPERRKKKANTLCFISLGLQILPFILAGLCVAGLNMSEFQTKDSSNSLITIILSMMESSNIASWVLMIIARVKYKESVFAKVLMWVYIALIALYIIAVVAFIAWCVSSCSGMPG
ncbi:MAG: hypothetical protein K5643_00825 [Saccharofermentans sp.]|nr:hypothetical protein [Saccharofermentans sp.]